MWCQTVALALLALCLPQGHAIKCHQCTSASDPKCGDPIDTSLPLVDCTPTVMKEGNALLKSAVESFSSALGKMGFDTNVQVPDASASFSCVKAVKQENDKKLVIRSCSIPKMESFDVCTKLKAEGTVTFCENCEKDGCNGASSAVPSSMLLLLAAALAAYFFTAKQ